MAAAAPGVGADGGGVVSMTMGSKCAPVTRKTVCFWVFFQVE
jgi:hypothetical protein